MSLPKAGSFDKPHTKYTNNRTAVRKGDRGANGYPQLGDIVGQCRFINGTLLECLSCGEKFYAPRAVIGSCFRYEYDLKCKRCLNKHGTDKETSYATIAWALDLSRNGVHETIVRALRKLRGAIGGLYAAPDFFMSAIELRKISRKSPTKKRRPYGSGSTVKWACKGCAKRGYCGHHKPTQKVAMVGKGNGRKMVKINQKQKG